MQADKKLLKIENRLIKGLNKGVKKRGLNNN